MLLRLALVGLLFLLSNSSRAQKNTLRLWVDTLYIDTAQTDVLLNVKFKLDVHRPPVNFRGYKAEIDSISFGSGFIQRRTTPVLPTFDTVKISLPPTTVSRDSTFDVPVIFDMTSESKLKHFAFSFDFDSSVVRFDDAYLASDIQGTLTKVIQPVHGDVFVESKDTNTLFGADTLFYLRVTSKGRTDTICTALSQVGLLPINDDAKVDTRVISIGDLCVQGFTPTPTKVVREYEGLRDLFISPNPASEIVMISLPEQKGRFSVEIFDAAGHTVHAASGIGRIEWRPTTAAAEAYNVIVTLDGRSVLRHVIIR
jgi:hypothetical protein